MALALFEDHERVGDVYGSANSRWGKWAADTLSELNKGAHTGVSRADLENLLERTERLTKELTAR